MQANMETLHNTLFNQLVELSKADGDKLDIEVKRADAMVSVAKCIIENGNLVLKATIAQTERIACNQSMPKMLGTNE